jgi:undecaprenyl-diphosphatase
MDSGIFGEALLLGVVEGLTEFLPVSSTGHLILVGDLLGISGPASKTFEIVIQLGAILAVCWAFRAQLDAYARGMFREERASRFFINIGLAVAPALAIGAFAHGYIKNVLFNPHVVSVSLITGGLAILAIERWTRPGHVIHIDDFSFGVSFKIGLCQAVSMIPGISRAGATIMGAMVLGVERRAATVFSFYLAIPTMFAATTYDLYKSWGSLTADGWASIGVGFVAAFLSALVVVRTLIGFVGRHGFAPFAWYRIAIGLAMLALLEYR